MRLIDADILHKRMQEEIREIVNLCCEELERFKDDKEIHRP